MRKGSVPSRIQPKPIIFCRCCDFLTAATPLMHGNNSSIIDGLREAAINLCRRGHSFECVGSHWYWDAVRPNKSITSTLGLSNGVRRRMFADSGRGCSYLDKRAANESRSAPLRKSRWSMSAPRWVQATFGQRRIGGSIRLHASRIREIRGSRGCCWHPSGTAVEHNLPLVGPAPAERDLHSRVASYCIRLLARVVLVLLWATLPQWR